MEMRKYAPWYLKGLKGNGKIRNLMNHIESREELAEFLYEYAHEIEGKTKVS